MDHPDGTPDWYRELSASGGVEASHRSIVDIRALPGNTGLVQPIVTPRFIPACTDELLDGLGRLAESENVLTQTHCSESDWEHGEVLERHGASDTSSLESFGLLRDHSVLAHGAHLTEQDIRVAAAAGAGGGDLSRVGRRNLRGLFCRRRGRTTGCAAGGAELAERRGG